MDRKRTMQELTSALATLRLHEAELTTQLEEAVQDREREREDIAHERTAALANRNRKIAGR